jgi:hypothetical protein
MSVLLRTRVASFLSGVAVTGVFAVYELRRDLAEGQALLVKQVREPSMLHGAQKGWVCRMRARGRRRGAGGSTALAAERSLLLLRCPQVDSHAKTMEERVTRLEGVVAQMHQAQAGA